MAKRSRWNLMILCLMVIIVLSVLFIYFNKLSEVKNQNDTIIEEQQDILKSIERELTQSTSPIYQSYGKIKEVEGMSRSLILSYDNHYRDYGNHFVRMLSALEESFNTFTGNDFTKEEDREFLAEQVSTILENTDQATLTLKLADTVYTDIQNQTREYYEAYTK